MMESDQDHWHDLNETSLPTDRPFDLWHKNGCRIENLRLRTIDDVEAIWGHDGVRDFRVEIWAATHWRPIVRPDGTVVADAKSGASETSVDDINAS